MDDGAYYQIKSFSARDISQFSRFPTEQESILLPATKLKVISKRLSSKYSGVYEFEMEEIDAASTGKSVLL